MNFLVIFIIPWVSISLTERNNCSFPAGLNEFFLNSGAKGLMRLERTHLINVKALINKLTDGLSLIGSANVGMVRYRRALLRKIYPFHHSHHQGPTLT